MLLHTQISDLYAQNEHAAQHEQLLAKWMTSSIVILVLARFLRQPAVRTCDEILVLDGCSNIL
jgi:hypothetical protein